MLREIQLLFVFNYNYTVQNMTKIYRYKFYLKNFKFLFSKIPDNKTKQGKTALIH